MSRRSLFSPEKMGQKDSVFLISLNNNSFFPYLKYMGIYVFAYKNLPEIYVLCKQKILHFKNKQF